MTNHPVVHFEIGCRDGAKTREFLKGLFGWDIAASKRSESSDT